MPPSSAAITRPELKEPALQIRTIDGVEPLDAQIGVFSKKTVPDALYGALFGQPDPANTDTDTEIEAVGGDAAAAPHMQTYAILDAAKLTSRPGLLERSGLQGRQLWQADECCSMGRPPRREQYVYSQSVHTVRRGPAPMGQAA